MRQMTRRDHGDGGIDSRGEGRHRLRWRVDGVRYSKTFKGSITEARRELRRLLKSADEDAFVEPRKQALGQYLIEWLDNATNLSPKSVERYRQLIRHQIIPHLGTVPLQKLRSDQIERWHFQLTKSGLHPRTVTNAHGLLTRALERAVRHRIIVRNEARGEKPPKVPHEEVQILTAAQIAEVLAGIEGHPLHPIASLALASGMRRGELCALKW